LPSRPDDKANSPDATAPDHEEAPARADDPTAERDEPPAKPDDAAPDRKDKAADREDETARQALPPSLQLKSVKQLEFVARQLKLLGLPKDAPIGRMKLAKQSFVGDAKRGHMGKTLFNVWEQKECRTILASLFLFVTYVSVGILLTGCQTSTAPTDPNAKDWYDRSLGKRENCWGYRVMVEVSDPGCRIELNDEHIATITNTVGEVILWGYKDGRLRQEQVVRLVANPVKPGQNQQVKVFRTVDGERAKIPRRIFFDLNLERAKPTEKIDIKVR
jgi:hypothetical protein